MDLWGALRLVRPVNCLLIGATAVTGAYVGAAHLGLADLPWLRVGLAAASGMLIAAGANALNDFLDRDIDRVGHPLRPLPSGRVSTRFAVTLAVVLLSSGLVVAATLGFLALLLVAIGVGLVAGYEGRWKSRGLVGNLVIGGLVMFPFLLGGIAADSLGPQVLLLGALAMLAMVGREIVKDIEDMKADEGRRTLARRYGPRVAAAVAIAAFSVAILVSPLPYLVAGLGGAYLPFVLAADVLLLLAAVLSALRPHLAQRLAKWSFPCALGGFVAGHAFA